MKCPACHGKLQPGLTHVCEPAEIGERPPLEIRWDGEGLRVQVHDPEAVFSMAGAFAAGLLDAREKLPRKKGRKR